MSAGASGQAAWRHKRSAAANIDTYDLLIIGAGINGAGIARDAAGRGLSVALCEQGDIGGATSSASSKLIHGGLRYLEQFAFRLVSESLAEREVLLRIAPHLTHARRFVLPHCAGMRPQWMVGVGLFLYDTLGSFRGGRSLPASRRIALATDRRGEFFKPEYRQGFVYSDVSVDDARLTLANVRAAVSRGARLLPRTGFVGARRAGDMWIASVEDAAGRHELQVRAIVNAAGPWVARVAGGLPGTAAAAKLRLVRGSHIVVPRLYDGDHACTLQNDDGRVCFLIPFQRDFTLVGTTELEVTEADSVGAISDAEIDYLCRAVNQYARHQVVPGDVVWSYSGVRPLIDDGKAAASSVSREYCFMLECGDDGGLPLLSIFGGKLTTYRRLAETGLGKLAKWFPQMGKPWTDHQPLPGGDLDGRAWPAFLADLSDEYPNLPTSWLADLAGRHGSECHAVLDGVDTVVDLGRNFSGGLFEREVDYCIINEWAMAAEDVLWRRTKCGLHMTVRQRLEFAEWFNERVR